MKTPAELVEEVFKDVPENPIANSIKNAILKTFRSTNVTTERLAKVAIEDMVRKGVEIYSKDGDED